MMSLQVDLENQIRSSYDIIREHEAIIQTTDRPEEKKRSQRQIGEQKRLIKEYLSQYIPLCKRLGTETARDIIEVAIVLKFPVSFSQQSSYAYPSPSEITATSITATSTKPFQSSFALVIGIAAYRRIRPLSKTTNDAHDIYNTLLKTGYSLSNTVLLLDDQATKNAISDKLNWLAQRANDNSTVIIFFSGHGAQFVGGFFPGEYLCPFEAAMDKPQETLISHAEFTTALRAIDAGRLVVFFDCCHAGGIGEPKDSTVHIKSGLSEKFYSQLAEGKGRVIIASCRSDEVSWELEGMRNGLFTHYLLEGLQGNAARDDGTVWMNNLFSYIYEHVSQGTSQHPYLKYTGEDFPIAIARK